MELTPRLNAIARLVPQGARFADIGTDHAYLPTWLILNGRISGAIASDLREGPLERGRAAAARYGIPRGTIDFRLCDGLAGLREGEADTIAIAGMGGETIAHILGAVPWSRNPGILYLLQPMSAQPDLRLWLQENGFEILEEQVAAEPPKLYPVLRVRPGTMRAYTPGELRVGRQWEGMQDENRAPYLEDTIRRSRRALQGMEEARDPAWTAQTANMRELIAQLTEMQKEWTAWQR